MSLTRKSRRRTPAGGVRLRPLLGWLFSEELEGRRLLSSVSFSNGVWTLNADSTAETIVVYRTITSSPTTDKTKFEINTNPITTYERDTADITSKIVTVDL